jgi:glycosyltransferase involved in cell wall biosynthesis
MKVSVIMPTYNDADYIGQSIESVLNQSHRDIELIVINDGSVDSTEEEVNKFQDPRIIYLKQKKTILISLCFYRF